jgi:hypothetical protein
MLATVPNSYKQVALQACMQLQGLEYQPYNSTDHDVPLI